MRRLIFLFISAAVACDNTSPPSVQTVTPSAACRGLFGLPNERTGTDESACTAACECFDGSHLSNDFFLDSPRFDSEHLNPIDELLENPYTLTSGAPQEELNTPVCAITFTPDFTGYELSTRSAHEVPRPQSHTLDLAGSAHRYRI